jgi:3-dehydroquinate synthase
MQIQIVPKHIPISYSYEIGIDILDNLISAALNNYKNIVVVTDSNVNRIFLQNTNLSKVIIQAGESSKCFEELEKLLNKFSELGVTRNDLIIAIGGGVIGDLTGFAASIYMRGVDYWQVPTTLVAMIDSSIGGKTGINTEFGKNLVGSFVPPKMIIADLKFLEKLPNSEIMNGVAEMYKHALIANTELIKIIHKDPICLESILSSAKIKIDIVQNDPFEKCERKYLNVGHTIAHAIEKDSKLEIPHGIAVAMGIKIETKIAYELGIISKENYNFVLDGLELLNINFDYKINNFESFIELMKSDKKNNSKDICFAFIEIPGEKILVSNVDIEKLKIILANI